MKLNGASESVNDVSGRFGAYWSDLGGEQASNVQFGIRMHA